VPLPVTDDDRFGSGGIDSPAVTLASEHASAVRNGRVVAGYDDPSCWRRPAYWHVCPNGL
jgi:hypothetical protein